TDKNTIWDFKQRLIEAGVMEKLFERFKGHLKDQGLIAQEGKTAEEWEDQAAKLRQKDTDARWAKKGEKVHFGYKNHVKVDEKSKLIEKYEVTDASVHDSQKVEDLVEKGDGSTVSSPSNGRVHGDSAYRSAQIEKDRKEKAVESRIHEKGYRNRPLTEEQKENNRQKSRVRARIDHVFGYMTNSMGGIFLTCIGIRRTTAAIGLMNLIYNMAWYEQLMRLANSS
ncbi:MAG: IS5 family transposase, partial [Deltaproteobacteria bacterium]|nr:IS5 family transposase [Deltaproteobacteria bacterium]